MASKQCKHCGNDFEGNKKKVFCSDSCRVMAHDKKNVKLAKTFINDKNPSIDVLEQKYPDVPKHLLKLAHNISVLRSLINDPDHPFTEGALRAVTQTHNRRVEILEIKTELHRKSQLRGVSIKQRLEGWQELNDRLIDLECDDAIVKTKAQQAREKFGER